MEELADLTKQDQEQVKNVEKDDQEKQRQDPEQGSITTKDPANDQEEDDGTCVDKI